MMTSIIPAILLIFGIISGAYSFLLLQFISKRTDYAIIYWALGAFLIGVATSITVFRNESNLFVTYVLANGIGLIGYCNLNWGIQQILGGPRRIKKNLITSVVTLFIYCISLEAIGIYFNKNYQAIFVSTLLCISNGYAGRLGWQLYRENKNYLAIVFSAIFFLNTALWFARALLASFGVTVNTFDPTTINLIIFPSIFLLGIFTYFLFIGLLFSKSKKEEQKALDRFEGMADTLPCALYEFYLYPNYTSEFRYVSPGIQELLGYTAEEVMRDSSLIIEQVHPDDKERFWRVNLEAYNTGKTFFIEMRMITLGGAVKWMQLSSSPRGKDFKNVAWSGYIIDVSERKFLEDSKLKLDLALAKNDAISTLLEEKNQLITGLLKANKTAATGALSASIAHELNQPLGASNLNIQLLKMKMAKGEIDLDLYLEVLNRLEAENNRASTIVRSLRSIFTEEGSHIGNVDIGEIIKSVLEICNPELKAKNIHIFIKNTASLKAKANSGEIQQVLLNLINNAIHAFESSGTLEKRLIINTSQKELAIQISVSDNAGGISKDRRENLFELLNTTKKSGMGLGLWLCKHIVTAYGGDIWYQDAVNGGAEFIFELPASQL